MGDIYLNKNSRFQCQAGNAVWFKPQNDAGKMQIRGAAALLEDCALSLVGAPRPGQCRQLPPDPATGMPLPCACAVIPGVGWRAGDSIKISGRKALTSASLINCPIGGTIKPFSPTFRAINVNNSAVYASVAISQNANNTETENNISTDKASGENLENPEQSAPLAPATANVVKMNEPNPRPKLTGGEAEQTEKKEDRDYALCCYKNCKKAADCEYLKAKSVITEENESKNAAALRCNLGKDSFDLYAGECGTIATSVFETAFYSVAHHHLVPVNQCFKKFPELVKLANYYSYDINNAKNGICLPTMNIGYDSQPFERRKEIAFSVMTTLGKQWHKGGHQYSCKISASLDKLLPRAFVHYKGAVDKQLIILRNNLAANKKCRQKNYQQQAEEFAKMLDGICSKIADKLRKFENSPEKSWPFFVSRLAFYFAHYKYLSSYEEEWFKMEHE